VVDDGTRETVVLYKKQGVLESVRGRQSSARVFKSTCYIHDNQGLILNNEDCAPFQGSA
jgi:hypothetical protein